jgi:perosamine synthetase
MGLFEGERYPVAERLARRGFYLPSGMALGEPEIIEVAEAVKNLLV